MRRWLSLLAATVLLAAGCGSSSPEKQAEELRSLAAEGALLADDVASGDTIPTFQRVHSAELRELAAALKVDGAEEVAAELGQLGDASPAEAKRIAAELREAAQ